MGKAWQDYSAMSASLSLADDDVLCRDKSDTTDNATHGTVLRLAPSGLMGLCGITPGGRITLESGVPVSTSNQTSKSTIYYTPYAHDWVRLYDGTRPKLYQFTERSLSLSGLTSGKNYDVFLYDNAGTLTLELSAAWTTDTARADVLAWQAGVGYVKSGTATRLWLGTIRTTGTTTTEDSIAVGSQSGGKAFVWNAYNQVTKSLCVYDTTDSWTYTTANTWRQAGGASGNKVEFVCGAPIAYSANVMGHALHNNNPVTACVAVGVDSTSSPSGIRSGAASSGALSMSITGTASGLVAAGYHYLAWLEATGTGSGILTWYGDAGGSLFNNGLHATISG